MTEATPGQGSSGRQLEGQRSTCKEALLCAMAGLSSTDPNEPNPIRVEDDSQVQMVLIKEFEVNEGEILIQVRDEGTGAFVPLPTA